jgi:hypothetical protein
MSSTVLYSNYSELSEENIKIYHCSIESYYVQGSLYRSDSKRTTHINFDDFMKSFDTSLNKYYSECICRAPVDPFNPKQILPNMTVFLRACKKSNIEKSKCLEMFDFEKIIDIDKLNAKKLSSLGTERCREYNRQIETMKDKEYISEQTQKCKKIASSINE